MDAFLHGKLHELVNEDRENGILRKRKHKTVTDIYDYLENKVIIPKEEYEKLKKLIDRSKT